MTYEQALALLQKPLSEISDAERKQLKEAIKIVAGRFAAGSAS